MSPIININSYIGDSIVKWQPYKIGDNIITKFSIEDWRKVASDIDSEEELQELLNDYPHRIQAFILYEVVTDNPIAFVYILKGKNNPKSISYHGGGWGKSTRLTMLYMRGTILLIEYLLKQGYKVTTYCAVDNTNAYRFMKGLGFVRYLITQQSIYQWINLKRLHKSTIYNYLKTR